MAKVKLSLTLDPTFQAKVQIPVAGKKPAEVEFTFKGRTRDQFQVFVDGLSGREDVEVILDIASGWDLEDPFGKDSIEKLCQIHIGAPRAIIEKYLTEITQARSGN